MIIYLKIITLFFIFLIIECKNFTDAKFITKKELDKYNHKIFEDQKKHFIKGNLYLDSKLWRSIKLKSPYSTPSNFIEYSTILFNKSKNKFENKNINEAFKLIELAISFYPDNEYYELYGDIFLLNNQLNEAKKAYKISFNNEYRKNSNIHESIAKIGLANIDNKELAIKYLKYATYMGFYNKSLFDKFINVFPNFKNTYIIEEVSKIINEINSPNYLVGKFIAENVASQTDFYYLCKYNKIIYFAEPAIAISEGLWKLKDNKILITWEKGTGNAPNNSKSQVINIDYYYFEKLFDSKNSGIADISSFTRFKGIAKKCIY